MEYQPITPFILGLLLGALLLFTGLTLLDRDRTNDDLIAEFYAIENAVSVSPHGLRGMMDKGDDSFILVDLRSSEEYEQEHFVGAVNIPAYSDKETSAYSDVERITNSFQELKEQYPNRDIITYCYSTACMTSRKVGKILVDNNIYIKHLNIGWYELRHDWESWNHEHEWGTDKVEDYIWSGSEPGEPKVSDRINPCVDGELGC